MTCQNVDDAKYFNDEADVYKSAFKRFKHGNDFSSAVDFAEPISCVQKTTRIPRLNDNKIPDCDISDHFKPFDQWEMYIVKDAVSGLIIIPQILRENHRLNWFKYFNECLPLKKEYELKANVSLEKYNDKLRWITFGYHHNWDSKVYSLDQPTVVVPKRIQNFCRIVSAYLNIDFTPEAGILNYYNIKSSLCFHTDNSELNHSTPLISFSLGSPAIFLIGGKTKDSATPIVPIVLRDSDLVIMSGDSRLALHAIAKTLPPSAESCSNCRQLNKSKICRINLNVRQVKLNDAKE